MARFTYNPRTGVLSGLQGISIGTPAQTIEEFVTSYISSNTESVYDSDLVIATVLKNLDIAALSGSGGGSGTGITDSDLAVVAELRRDADSDSIAIQALTSYIDNQIAILASRIDSDYALTNAKFASIRFDLDSEIFANNTKFIEVNNLLDSESSKVSSLKTRVFGLVKDNDSDHNKRLNELESNADSDEGALAGFKRFVLGQNPSGPTFNLHEYYQASGGFGSNPFHDSDLVIATAIKGFNVAAASYDSDRTVQTILKNIDVAALTSSFEATLDSEEVYNMGREHGWFYDSDKVMASVTKNTVAIINIVNNNLGKVDSDFVFTMLDSEEVVNMFAEHGIATNTAITQLKADLDSETARIQLLLSNADSDQIAIAELRRDADSDSVSIQAIRTQAALDGAYITLLRADLDSDTTAIQALRTDMDSESARINARLSDIESDVNVNQASNTVQNSRLNSLEARADSDELVLQLLDGRITTLENAIDDSGFDSDQVVTIINENVIAYDDSTLVARLDSDELVLQLLDGRIGTLENSGDVGTSARLDSDEIVIQSHSIRLDVLEARADSDETVLQLLDGRITTLENQDGMTDSDLKVVSDLRNDLDSDFAAFNSRLNVAETDIDNSQSDIVTIQSRLDSAEARLDSDETAVQSLSTRIDTLESQAPMTDSDLKAVADLRNDLDSDFTAFNTRITSNFNDIQTLNSTTNSQGGRITLLELSRDSESAKVQAIQGSVNTNTATLNAYGGRIAALENNEDSDTLVVNTLRSTVDSLRSDIDSETARIQLILLSQDSDALSLGALRRDADSDAAVIVVLKQNAESDSLAIQALSTTISPRLDSDEAKLQVHSGRLDVLESRADSDEIAISARLPLAGGTMSGDIDGNGNKVLFANVYANEVDLPNATTYHGMFAHVHATGAGYFAHAGNWIKLANNSDITTINSRLDSDETVIQSLQTQIDNFVGIGDSDLAVVATLRNDVDNLRADADSDSIEIQALREDVDALVAGTYNDAPLVARLDSDTLAISALRRDVDSDSLVIQSLQTQIDNIDVADLRARLDSDSTVIQSIRTSVDSDYALFNAKIALFNGLTDSDLTTVAELRNDVDSDSTKLQALQETVDSLNSLSREDSDIINLITGARLVNTVQVIGGAQTDVDSFLANDIRAAKYIVVVSSDSDSTYQTDELLVVHDGSAAYVTQYGQINTADSELATFDASLTAGSVYLKATGTRNNIRFDAQRLQVNVANGSIIIGAISSMVVDSDSTATFAATFGSEMRFQTSISRDPSNNGTNADLMTTRLATALQNECDNFPANTGNLQYGHFVFYNNGSPVYDFCSAGIPSIFNNRINPGDITVIANNGSTRSAFRVSMPTNLVFSPQFEGTTYNPGQWTAGNNGNTEFDEFRLYLNNNTTGVTEANSTLAFSATVAALTAP